MDAVKFLREKGRMCNENSTCNQCELYKSEIDCTGSSCKKWMEEYPEDAVAFMEKWAAEHPIKTRQSEFLKHYPDARTFSGCLNVCPRELFGDTKINCNAQPCYECKKEFWLAEVEE